MDTSKRSGSLRQKCVEESDDAKFMVNVPHRALTLDDLHTLPRLALIALAARSARRVQPVVQEHREIIDVSSLVDNAIRDAEHYSMGPSSALRS